MALARKRSRLGARRVFRLLTTASGATVLVIIVAIAAFLIVKAIPALQADKANFLTHFKSGSRTTRPTRSSVSRRSPSVPSSPRRSPCSSRYRSRWASRCACRTTPTGGWPPGLGFMIDLLAAVPSIVFGLWGRDYLSGPVRDFSGWLHHYFGWIPLFG